MNKFIIRAYLRTPLIKQGYMTLDALLMAVLERGDVSDLIKCTDGLYCASAAFTVDEIGTEKAAFVASMRPELTPEWVDVIASNSKSGDVGIGDRRAREGGNVISTYEASLCRAVEWYGTGDKDAVLAALQDVKFVGKRRASGFGEVVRWEVEDGELDGIVGYLGEPLRPVPADRWTEGGDHVAVDTAWKPPYWAVGNRDRCYAPMD